LSRLIYRIPSKPWYRDHKIDPDFTWQKVYGDKKCAVCGQNYRELEAYMMCPDGERSKHVDCPPCQYLNDVGGCTINGDCKQRTPEDRLKRQCKVPVVRKKKSIIKATTEAEDGCNEFRF
jgi:hypothetical protein